MFYSTQKGQFLIRAQKLMGYPAKIKQFSIMFNVYNIIKTNTKHIFYVSTIFQIWPLQR